MSEGSINLDIEDGWSEVRRGPWTLEEDNLLTQYIASHGEGRWNSLAISAGLRRTGKSCRLRWLNYLNPHTKRGNLTPHEQLLILDLHSRWGNRWSRIAQHLPGRTDNEIKNYWRSRVQKQARQLKVDSNSKKFLEAIRLYWMPRLLEKMEQDSSSLSSSSSISQPQSLAASPSPPLQISHPVLPDSDSLEISEFESLGKSFVEGCYHVDIPGCGMQELDLGCEGVSSVDVDWFRPAMESSFWNSDELWQFKKLE